MDFNKKKLLLEMVLPFRARPKERARTGRGRHYTPSRTLSFERAVGLAAALKINGGRISHNPIETEIVFSFEMAKSWPKSKKELVKNNIDSEYLGVYHTSKPDIDNLEKSIYDALNGVVWADDSQVFKSTKIKKYSTVSKIEIKIYEIISKSTE